MERTGKIKFYYDTEGDYMQVTFQKKAGYFCETEDDRVIDRVMEKVDAEGMCSAHERSGAKTPRTSVRPRARSYPPGLAGGLVPEAGERQEHDHAPYAGFRVGVLVVAELPALKELPSPLRSR